MKQISCLDDIHAVMKPYLRYAALSTRIVVVPDKLYKEMAAIISLHIGGPEKESRFGEMTIYPASRVAIIPEEV